MSRDLIIVGASGHGKVAVDVANQMNKWENIYFLDDNDKLNEINGHKVIGNIDSAKEYKNGYDFFVAIGDNYIRQKVYNFLVKFDVNIITLIHPNSTISDSVLIGEGTIVMPGAVINADSTVGKCCIINTSASIDHDNRIRDFVHISPGSNLGGNVIVENMSWIGIGSTILNNVCIGEGIIIGASSLVLRSIKESGTYVGIPVQKSNKTYTIPK
ncbi:acetyltransferase [Piscibacillus salipiscarius]|uniref:acetyltransferase n=1 Tax=Piscibacillus salipiscarius TaxID=299480 RepID=UPI003F6E75E3